MNISYLKVSLISILLLTGNVALYGQNFQRADAFTYSFPESENRLLADFGENASELQRMCDSLQQHRPSLLENTSHLLIVGHLASWQYMETEAVNEISQRADRIRKYIRLKLKIPYESIAFYIDRSGLDSDQVHVYRVNIPLPWFANQEICYSESRYAKSMEDAIDKYGAIPFVEQYKRLSGGREERIVYMICDALFEREEVSDYRLLISGQPISSKSLKKTEAVQETASQVTNRAAGYTESAGKPVVASEARAGTRPFNLALKTNLLPWCGLPPSVLLGNGPVEYLRGSFMPNVELEYCFSNRWSVDASFLFAYYTYGSHPENLWGISSATLEPRFWLAGDNRFRWLWLGIFGQYGDFDVRGERISSDGQYGRTGKFASAGVSVGCMIPLGAGFCVEAALQGGYRSVFNGEKYRYDKADDKNYQESLFNATGMMMGLRLSVVYRIGIR